MGRGEAAEVISERCNDGTEWKEGVEEVSEGDGQGELAVAILVIAAFVLMLLIFGGADSLIQDAYLRDLQRRVGTLESERR